MLADHYSELFKDSMTDDIHTIIYENHGESRI